jgi:hypothetical protein
VSLKRVNYGSETTLACICKDTFKSDMIVSFPNANIVIHWKLYYLRLFPFHWKISPVDLKTCEGYIDFKNKVLGEYCIEEGKVKHMAFTDRDLLKNEQELVSFSCIKLKVMWVPWLSQKSWWRLGTPTGCCQSVS